MAEAVTHGVKLPARTLRAVPAAAAGGATQWLVGTTSLREDNELCVLEYEPSTDRLRAAASWAHPHEVWDAAVCPEQPQRIVTVHCRGGAFGATLWAGDASSPQLEPLAQLQHAGVVRRALWRQQQPGSLLTVAEGALRLWDVGGAAAQEAACLVPPDEQPDAFWAAACHPRNAALVLAAAGDRVQLWDVASRATVASVPAAHRQPVRDVSWAPSDEHRFASGGDDGKLRFWDTRLLGRGALLELAGHSHWVWNVCFSPFYDQLLLSSSTDTTVALWHTPALARLKVQPQHDAAAATSVRPGGGSGGQGASRHEPGDGRVLSYDEHEDSVYGAAWSGADAWLFASMSYDGRLAVHRVPKGTKYKILI